MKTCSLIAAVLAGCALPTLALAQGAEHNGNHDVQVWLDGYQEVPSVSTTGSGVLRADAGAALADHVHALALRLLLPERLIEQHMADLRGADA